MVWPETDSAKFSLPALKDLEKAASLSSRKSLDFALTQFGEELLIP